MAASQISSTPNPDNLTPKSAEINSPSHERPLYSSKVSDQKSRPAASPAASTGSSLTPSPANNRQAAAPQKAWTGAKNPITARSQTIIPLKAHYQKASLQQADSSSFLSEVVQQKKGPNSADMPNGTSRRDNPSFQRKDSGDARVMANNSKNDGRSTNGSRTGFRTDTGISNSRALGGRELQRWEAPADSNLDQDMSLESATKGPVWDQFKVNENLFGVKTDYHEDIYTTPIDKAHPNYHQRASYAEKKAREIERSVAVTSHQAEERIMDHAGGEDDRNEEDKYSGVRRNDIPPLQSRDNKYTPPARRAPTGHTTVKGAPVDPAIISSQLKVDAPKQTTAKSDENKSGPATAKPSTVPTPELEVTGAKPNATPESKIKDGTTTAPKPAQDTKSSSVKPQTPTAAPVSRPAVGTNTSAAPPNEPTIEQNVLGAFKTFAAKERETKEKTMSRKARADKEVKLHELKKFGSEFKLSTPVPPDLIPIIAKDPEKRKAIEEKTMRDAQEVAKAKANQEAAAAATKQKQSSASKEASQTKMPTEPTASTSTTPAPPGDTRGAARPTAPQHSSSPSAVPGRNPVARQQYAPQMHYQPSYNGRDRGNRQNSQFGGQQPSQTGNLGQRIRENKMHQPQHQHMGQHMPMDMRPPPTGPANFDAPYGARRLSGLPPAHLQQARLNPNSHEFKPNAFAVPFNPAGTSQVPSPRAPVNNVVEPARTPPAVGQLIRRKTKAVDVTKCNILSFLKTVKPPTGAPSYDENLGLRPSFQTPVTWRQLQDLFEKADSTMHLTYKEYFARQPSSSAAAAVSNSQHGPASMPHQHQLPLHLQGGPHMGPRQSPHMPTMPMHNAQHGAMQPIPFVSHPDDHRMMHSNSAQSFASPRMASQMPMAYPPNMNSPAQMPYAQPVMQPFLNNGPPPMNPNMRSFSHNPQYGMHQQHAMGPQVMFQPQYMPQNGMGPVQVPMYNGAPGQFMPPPIPAPSVAGSNGFPSPGRPTAPMMAHNGSHQGQALMYGVTPGVQYQQPYPPHQPPNKYQGPRP